MIKHETRLKQELINKDKQTVFIKKMKLIKHRHLGNIISLKVISKYLDKQLI